MSLHRNVLPLRTPVPVKKLRTPGRLLLLDIAGANFTSVTTGALFATHVILVVAEFRVAAATSTSSA